MDSEDTTYEEEEEYMFGHRDRSFSATDEQEQPDYIAFPPLDDSFEMRLFAEPKPQPSTSGFKDGARAQHKLAAKSPELYLVIPIKRFDQLVKVASLDSHVLLEKVEHSYKNTPPLMVKPMRGKISFNKAELTLKGEIKVYIQGQYQSDLESLQQDQRWTQTLQGCHIPERDQDKHWIRLVGVEQVLFFPTDRLTNARIAIELVARNKGVLDVVMDVMTYNTNKLIISIGSRNQANHALSSGLKFEGGHYDCEKHLTAKNLWLCSRCQQVGHKTCSCERPTVCEKCGGHHFKTECTALVLRCCNCGGEHGARDKSCPRTLQMLDSRRFNTPVPTPDTLLDQLSKSRTSRTAASSSWADDTAVVSAPSVNDMVQEAGCRTPQTMSDSDEASQCSWVEGRNEPHWFSPRNSP